jgi:hypothetical protein
MFDKINELVGQFKLLHVQVSELGEEIGAGSTEVSYAADKIFSVYRRI